MRRVGSRSRWVGGTGNKSVNLGGSDLHFILISHKQRISKREKALVLVSYRKQARIGWILSMWVRRRRPSFQYVPGLVWDAAGGRGTPSKVCSEGGLFCLCVGGREAE